MRSDELYDFAWIATVNPLKNAACERLIGMLHDQLRWEPLAELAEDRETNGSVEEESLGEEWLAPLREAALRKMLARNLALLEVGLKPFDPKLGAEEVAVGAAGRIDLLCKDKDENLVVVELKRDTSSDHVAGQLLRYMGYVKENHLAKENRARHDCRA